MTEKYLAQPDLDFIAQVKGLGGETLKKCYQCATCSVACPIAPDDSPFPRKEMIAASWGLKDKLIKNGDIWLCHQCGDCTDLCPRGAAPGDVLAAVRSVAIEEYAQPKALANHIAGTARSMGSFFGSFTAFARALGCAYSSMATVLTAARTSPGAAPRGQRSVQSPH